MTKQPFGDSPLAKFIAIRIQELRGHKTQAEIAAQAGFRTPNLIAMLKSGATKVALGRIPRLAEALETDPAHLLRLALRQPGNELSARAITEIFGTVASRNETRWLEAIRQASGDTDPPLTEKSLAALRTIFDQ